MFFSYTDSQKSQSAAKYFNSFAYPPMRKYIAILIGIIAENNAEDVKTSGLYDGGITYEDFFEKIKRVLNGDKNVIWPEEITWFAKSSGTTNDVSKFIPVSKESLDLNHLKAGRDLLSVYLKNNKKSKLFDGLALALGGSKQITPYDDKKKIFISIMLPLLINGNEKVLSERSNVIKSFKEGNLEKLKKLF